MNGFRVKMVDEKVGCFIFNLLLNVVCCCFVEYSIEMFKIVFSKIIFFLFGSLEREEKLVWIEIV